MTMQCFSQSKFVFCIRLFIMRSWYCSIQIALSSDLQIKCKCVHIILTYSTWHIYIFYEVRIIYSFWKSCLGFLYILKFAKMNLSAVFSRQCEERSVMEVHLNTVVFMFTVIVYVCLMHKYMLVRKYMEVHEYEIFSNIILRHKLK